MLCEQEEVDKGINLRIEKKKGDNLKCGESEELGKVGGEETLWFIGHSGWLLSCKGFIRCANMLLAAICTDNLSVLEHRVVIACQLIMVFVEVCASIGDNTVCLDEGGGHGPVGTHDIGCECGIFCHFVQRGS